MERFVFNVRRWPRIPAHCRVVISNRGIQWAAETEDVGPGGCQLVSPRVIAAGSEVKLAIATEALAERLSILGRVAWASPVPPIRLGIAFVQQLASMDPRAWFERLLQTEPSFAAAIHRLPDRLPASSILYLGQPPRFVIDFTPNELVILRQVKDGTRIDSILVAAGFTSAAVSQAIFSLLARRALVLNRAEAVPASRWIDTLVKAGAAQSEEQLRLVTHSPVSTIARKTQADSFSLPLRGSDRAPTASPGDPSSSRMDARLEHRERSRVSPKSDPQRNH